MVRLHVSKFSSPHLYTIGIFIYTLKVRPGTGIRSDLVLVFLKDNVDHKFQTYAMIKIAENRFDQGKFSVLVENGRILSLFCL